MPAASTKGTNEYAAATAWAVPLWARPARVCSAAMKKMLGMAKSRARHASAWRVVAGRNRHQSASAANAVAVARRALPRGIQIEASKIATSMAIQASVRAAKMYAKMRTRRTIASDRRRSRRGVEDPGQSRARNSRIICPTLAAKLPVRLISIKGIAVGRGQARSMRTP